MVIEAYRCIDRLTSIVKCIFLSAKVVSILPCDYVSEAEKICQLHVHDVCYG